MATTTRRRSRIVEDEPTTEATTQTTTAAAEPIKVEPVQEPAVSIEDPLTGAEPEVRDYAKLDVKNSGGAISDIPEAPITKPVIDFNDNMGASTIDTGTINPEQHKQTEKEEPKKQSIFEDTGNEDLQGVTGKEKNEASRHMAQTIIDAYEMLHGIFAQLLVKSDEKLLKQVSEGKLDIDTLDSEIDFGNKNIYQVRALIFQYNKTVQETLVVNPEVKDEMLPILIRICKKRNWGMTDEQRLVAIVLQDAAPKVQKLIELTSSLKTIIGKQDEIIRTQKELIAQKAQATPPNQAVVIDDLGQDENKKKKKGRSHSEPGEAEINQPIQNA